MRSVEWTCQNPLTGLALVLIMMFSVTGVSAAERTWTRSEILAIADREAQRRGYRAERWGVSVDFYNSGWARYLEMMRGLPKSEKSEAVRQIESRLSGRSVWAVSYRSPLGGAAKTYGLFVFIDRDSGAVIGSFTDSKNKWEEG